MIINNQKEINNLKTVKYLYFLSVYLEIPFIQDKINCILWNTIYWKLFGQILKKNPWNLLELLGMER